MKHIVLLISLLVGSVALNAAVTEPTLQLDSVVSETPPFDQKTKQVYAVDGTGRQRG